MSFKPNDIFALGMQAAVDRMMESRKDGAQNMRLGQVIEALEHCDSMLPVFLEEGCGVSRLESYRGYYEDLSFVPSAEISKVYEVLEDARNALGETFQGYKGGDYVMHKQTLMWVAPHGDSGGRMLTRIEQLNDRVVLVTELHPDYLPT